MMQTLIRNVVRALSSCGLRAVPAFPEQPLPILSEPLAAVGIEARSTKRLPHGVFFSEQTVFIDLYTGYRNGAQLCEEAAQTVESLFLEGLADYCILSIRRGEMYHDAPSDCYRLRMRVEITSYEEEGV